MGTTTGIGTIAGIAITGTTVTGATIIAIDETRVHLIAQKTPPGNSGGFSYLWKLKAIRL